MNIRDIAVLAVLALFILAGLYRGFLPTLMSIAANVISWASGMIFMPIVSHMVTGNKALFNMLLYYTEGSEFIGDVELAKTAVSSINSTNLTSIINKSSLPMPFAKEIAANVKNRAFEAAGAVTLGDYYNQTIVCVVINIIAFLLIFCVIRILLALIIEGVDYSLRLPVLTQLDKPLSAGFGLLNGICIMFIAFMVMPMILIILDFDFVHNLVDSSFFTPIFYNANLLLSLIPGTC